MGDPSQKPGPILREATKKGDANAVEKILKRGFEKGNGPGRINKFLNQAAELGHRDVVKILLEHGATVDAPTPHGWTPLLLAAKGGYTDVMVALLDAGANINARLGSTGYTPLHLAASLDSCDALHLLVAKGALVRQTADDNTQAIHVAVKNGQRLNTLILCAFSSDPHAKDSNDKTAFDYADELQQPLRNEIKDTMDEWSVQGKKLSSLWENLVKFVDNTGKIDFKSWYASDHNDQIGLIYAVEIGGTEIVDWKDSRGRTALHYAATRGNVKHVKFLLSKGADVECRSKKRQWTALLMAADAGRKQTVRILLDHGADLEAKTDMGDNAIALAQRMNHLETVKLLESRATSPARHGSPHPFQVVGAGEKVSSLPTDRPIRRARTLRPDEIEVGRFKPKREPNKPGKQTATDVEHNPDAGLDVEGGFDGGLFSTPDPGSGLVHPKTFDELLRTWKCYFDFKDKDKRIRVAVLDTGIDLDHEDWLQPRALGFEHSKPVPASGEPIQIDRIKNKMNFCSGSETDVQDLDGHGTQVAGIILRLAPRADVDVARVCVGNRNRGISKGGKTDGSSADRCPQPSAVAKAIDWAVENPVDIINMSFGYEYSPNVVREALKRAQQKRIIVFAAMSNGGSFEKAKWPAREEMCAIGIHSCDENGTKSGFTPLRNPNTDNFMVVGDNVLTHWPMSKGRPFRLDSGTSFATPVAAAMAALILAFVEQNIGKGNRKDAQELIGLEVLEELHENIGMIRLFKSISFAGPDPGYLLIHPQLLWKDLQFAHRKSGDSSKCRQHAWDVIVNALMP
ncbi:ankyrin [Annulohypoxylon bovei var. microspora]|nr:ankyrin [Annulohypoxylon bovei var. microspora]